VNWIANLFAEGNQPHLWRRLVPHPCERSGVPGFQFALWAPRAQAWRCSVISTTGMAGTYPMQQRLGGIWGACSFLAWRWATVYKYEVAAARGALLPRKPTLGFQA